MVEAKTQVWEALNPLLVFGFRGRLEVSLQAERGLEFEATDSDLTLEDVFGALYSLRDGIAVQV